MRIELKKANSTISTDLRHYPVKFFQFYQMSVSKFDFILTKLAQQLRKKATNLRQPISPEQILVLTLR